MVTPTAINRTRPGKRTLDTTGTAVLGPAVDSAPQWAACVDSDDGALNSARLGNRRPRRVKASSVQTSLDGADQVGPKLSRRNDLLD